MLPNFKMGEVLRRKAQIKDALYASSVKKVEYVSYVKLAKDILPLLLDEHLVERKHEEVLNSIFVRHQDEYLVPTTVEALATKIAGWSDELTKAIPFSEWNTKTPVWAPLFIDDVERASIKDKKIYHVTISSHSGLTSGRIWHKLLPARFMQGLVRIAGGAKWHKYLDEDASRLWVTALLVVLENKMSFKMMHASDSQKRMNKDLLEGRQSKCSGGFRNGPCMNCPLGVGDCKFSRHIKRYEKDVCAFEPPKHIGYIVRDRICLHCLMSGRVAEKKIVMQGK